MEVRTYICLNVMQGKTHPQNSLRRFRIPAFLVPETFGEIRLMSTFDTSGAAQIQEGCPQSYWAKWLWIAAVFW